MPSPAVHKPTYAVCNVVGSRGGNIRLEFGQVPGYAAAVRGEVQNLPAALAVEGAIIAFTLLEFGKDDTQTCDNGAEFNPLEEKYNGILVPY